MKKLKVTKYCGMEVNFIIYVIDFVREAGQTYAITINEFDKIEVYNIKDLEIDYHNFIKYDETCY